MRHIKPTITKYHVKTIIIMNYVKCIDRIETEAWLVRPIPESMIHRAKVNPS